MLLANPILLFLVLISVSILGIIDAKWKGKIPVVGLVIYTLIIGLGGYLFGYSIAFQSLFWGFAAIVSALCILFALVNVKFADRYILALMILIINPLAVLGIALVAEIVLKFFIVFQKWAKKQLEVIKQSHPEMSYQQMPALLTMEKIPFIPMITSGLTIVLLICLFI